MIKTKIAIFFILTFLLVGFHVSAQEQDYQSIKKDGVESYTNEYPQPQKDTVKKDVEKSPNDKKWKWDRFRVGGNLGLSFGSVTYVEVSPTFGYWVIPDKLQVGVGTKFIYQSVKYNNGDRYKSILYGGGFFGDYVIWRGLFAHVEYELINKESYFNPNRVNVSHLLIGGGYLQPIGDYGNFYIAALFNVLDSDESIYRGTFGDIPLILRMGFGFGFPGGRRK